MKTKEIFLIIFSLSLVFIIGIFAIKSNTQNKNQSANFSDNIQNIEWAKTPEIVELKNGDTFNLSAGYVKKQIGNSVVRMLAYNKSIPGPTIKVQKGSEVTINFTNNTDSETTIHSHGLRLENKFDGVPDVTQKAIKPGESFSYKIKFPDEGIFIYHPHIRVDRSLGLGLYGNYVVTSDKSDYWAPVNKEVTLMLSDTLVNPKSGEVVPFEKTLTNFALMGRFGNTMIVNGETSYKLETKTGEVVRLYLTNIANARVFDFSIPGAKMKLVGADGGRYEKEKFVDSVILAPSERAVVDVLFDKSGELKMKNITPPSEYSLGSVNVLSGVISSSFKNEFLNLRVNNDVASEISNLSSYFDKKADKNLKLEVDMGNMGMHAMHMMGNTSEKIEWEDPMPMMNAMLTSADITWKFVDQDSGKENMDISLNFKKGDKVKVKIWNDPNSPHPMQHPVHFHGQRFLVLSTNGVKNSDLVWKDTVLIGKGDTVELLLDTSNPGTWMAHCHIAEHAESGMMMSYKVE